MRLTLVSDLRTPARVLNVHNAPGTSYWKCLTRRLGLRGAWEAVEWARLPPGGVSGEHVHTRTEELYFILAGVGRITWEGGSRLVQSGDLIATPLGARHGLTNIEHDFLDWLVVEVSAPRQAAVLAGQLVPDEPMRRADPVSLHIVNLRRLGQFDPRTVLDGPMCDVRLIQLSPGGSVDLPAAGIEYSMFTVEGSGMATDGAETLSLTAGVSLTVQGGGQLSIQAANTGTLEFFVVSLAIDQEVNR